MSIVVQKYGGSSVANPERIREVAARIARTREEGHRVVVVVSAMGDTTDELLALARQITERPDRRELDMLLTAGERISMALLSLSLNDLGVAAISFTGSQSGIVTNDAHANARIVEVRPYRIQDELERGKVVIVAGYQGVSWRREVTTLGRGGSDTTAVALAAALGAKWCEICSDVDGVYSADPRVVPQARKIAELTYEEMQALAQSGARVLNAQAVEFARERGIALYARATFMPGAGTAVRETRLHPPAAPGHVTAVASDRDVAIIRLEDATPDEFEELAALLDTYGIASKQARLGADGASFLVSLEDAHLLRRCHGQAIERFGARITLEQGFGTVSCVGAGINASHDKLRRALRTLNVAGLCQRDVLTGSHRLDFLLPKNDVARAVRALHAEFVEGS